MSHFGIGGHGDSLTKLFGGYKRCCYSQWPLTGRYFKRLFNKAALFEGRFFQNGLFFKFFQLIILNATDVIFMVLARVFNIILGFTDWFLYNLIKLWRAPTIMELNILSWNFAHYQYLQKDVWEFFKFCLDLELFAKIKKISVSDTPLDPVF